jgi:hypothetical protein
MRVELQQHVYSAIVKRALDRPIRASIKWSTAQMNIVCHNLYVKYISSGIETIELPAYIFNIADLLQNAIIAKVDGDYD